MSKPALVSPAPSSPPLSAARQALRSAIERRQAGIRELDARVKIQQRAESLIAAVPPMKARLAALEAKASDQVRDWAISGAAGKPQIDNADEVEDLRADIIESERLAAAAEGSMAQLRDGITSAQSDVRSASDRIKAAATAVLVAESEADLLMLATHVQAAIELRGKLTSLQWHLQRYGGPAALLQKRLDQIPVGTLQTDARCRVLIEEFKKFADRLLGDPNATLDSDGGLNVHAA